jgi:hypothetical protein
MTPPGRSKGPGGVLGAYWFPAGVSLPGVPSLGCESPCGFEQSSMITVWVAPLFGVTSAFSRKPSSASAAPARQALPALHVKQQTVKHPLTQLGLGDPELPRSRLRCPLVLIAHIQLLPNHVPSCTSQGAIATSLPIAFKPPILHNPSKG